MTKLRAWLRPPRNLLALFGLVILLPTATLIALGVRLLDQDRVLARQRQSELLEHAADQGVRALSQDFDAIRKRLDGPACEVENRSAASAPSRPDCRLADIPEGAVWVVLLPDRFEATPPQRIPYFPRTPALRDAASEPFRELESIEFGAVPNLGKALDISRRLSQSQDVAVRAGALLREARIFREMGRPEEALAAYAALSRIDSVAVLGEPAPLFARRARCAVLEEQSRERELRAEADALATDLRAGKWQLDRETYLHVADLLGHWTTLEIRPSREDQALAAGVAWLYGQWTGQGLPTTSAGDVHVLHADGQTVTIVWTTAAGRAAAFVAGQRFLEAHWMMRLRSAVAPARAYVAGISASVPPVTQRVQRSAGDTGLPWNIMLTADGDLEPEEFMSRRRNLFAGLAAAVALFASACFFLWRWVNRDLALARLQSEFVSAVSHEFRTPLTALRQFNELLEEDDGPTPEKRRRYYAAQSRATERLHRLVEGVLDFARMEAGRRPYRFETVDAASLASDVTEEFRKEAGCFSVACTAGSASYRVDADREALARALWNLLDNVAKYSGASREIEVRISRAADAISIGVRDHGIGVPAAEQQRIFEKFVRGAAARTAGIKGTGLGLAMIRHIVEGHRGTVHVKSAPGEGSEFTIVLPAKEEA
jgi:signal transduction histidine kinase